MQLVEVYFPGVTNKLCHVFYSVICRSRMNKKSRFDSLESDNAELRQENESLKVSISRE